MIQRQRSTSAAPRHDTPPLRGGRGEGVSDEAEAAAAWLRKHLASAPERDEAWYRRVLQIYGAPANLGEQVVAEEVSH